MTRVNRLRRLLPVLALVLFCCGSIQATAAEFATIRMGHNGFSSEIPFYTGRDAGIFVKHGFIILCDYQKPEVAYASSTNQLGSTQMPAIKHMAICTNNNRRLARFYQLILGGGGLERRGE